VYRLARDCARDEVVRKFVAPALELIMLDKALSGKFDREEALLLFGEMYATALAGDGAVGPREVELAVGGELGGGATLLRLAALYLLNELLSKELKFYARIYVGEGRYYHIAAFGENAARFKRLLAVTAPSSGGEYLSEKFNEFVKEARVEVRVDNIRLTESGVAADLTISEGGIEIKYNVYLRRDILLDFHSADRSRAELAARLLGLAGVSAEVRKEGGRDVWYVYASTDMLAAGREELRSAIAEVVKKAVEKGWVDAGKAKRWLEKLEEGRVLKEGWPKYNVRLDHHGALVVSFGSTNPDSIEREAQRLRKMGLVEDKHFTVKMPEEGHEGYVRILKKGLAYAAWLSVHGEDEKQRRLAAAFVELILQRAREAGENVLKKAEEIVEKGKERRSLTLNEFEKKVEVNVKEYVVKVIDGEAVEEDIGGKTLLRIRITAEVGRVEGGHIVDRVVREYEIIYGRYHKNAAVGYAYARADVPGGREADAERYSALIKALTGRKPNIRRRKDGKIEIKCYEGHLEGFMRYKELADAIERWLEETGR
jgi:PaRep2b protein.